MATFGSLNNTNVENNDGNMRFSGGVMSVGGTLTDVAIWAAGWVGGAHFRIAVYQGGSAGDPTGATLIWESGEIVDSNGTVGWRTAVASWSQSVSGTLAAARTWIFVKCNDGTFGLTNGDKGDWDTGSELSSIGNTPGTAFPSTVPSDAGSGGAETIKAYLTFTSSSDTTPDAFSFTDQTAVPVSSVRTSNTVTIAGIDTASAVTVTGGEWQKNGGSWGSSAGTVVNGDTVAVRHTSSASEATATNTTLTIGGVSDTFTSTTQDSVPTAFAFTDQSGVAPSSVITSNTLTLAGVTVTVAISVAGGEYQINGGSWTTSPGTISNGDTFAVRGTSSSGPGVATNVTLTIGGVADTFTFTTAGTPIVVMGGRLSSFP